MEKIIKQLKRKLLSRVLTQEQQDFWNANGFLILPNFFEPEKLETFLSEVNEIWQNRQRDNNPLVIDILEGSLVGKRMKLKDVPEEVRTISHKLNDLYLISDGCRSLSLDPKLCLILEELLDGEPMIINSLTFEKGSQQPYHFDTYYMPPPVQNKMAVSSICLEDYHVESGPLKYYPKSHKIPPYTFSHGHLSAVDTEMPQATDYIETQIEKHGLQSETFVGKAGDVFLWHAQLYHGGQPVLNPHRTRRSLVTHYWRFQDVDSSRVGKIGHGQNYLKRDHQLTS
ncbi:MAG: phytanoyl-CoA dioxygenase family protein [Waterburya sp.]